MEIKADLQFVISGFRRDVNENWQFLTYVSGQPIGPIFKVLEIQERIKKFKNLDLLVREAGTDRLSRNFGKELSLYAV